MRVLSETPTFACKDAVTVQATNNNPTHRHRRSQLLFAEVGTMLVRTSLGVWMVPSHQAIWIPQGIPHSIAIGWYAIAATALILTCAAMRDHWHRYACHCLMSASSLRRRGRVQI